MPDDTRHMPAGQTEGERERMRVMAAVEMYLVSSCAVHDVIIAMGIVAI